MATLEASVGSIAVSYYDPNVIYVGGGEKNGEGQCFFWLWRMEKPGCR